MPNCRVCGRALRDSKSVAAGIGPWCRHAEEVAESPIDWSETAHNGLREYIKQRQYDHDGNYIDTFFRCGSKSRWMEQLRKDLLDAISFKWLSSGHCGYNEQQRAVEEDILNSISRAEAYGGGNLQLVAMLAIVGIEYVTRGKEANYDADNN